MTSKLTALQRLKLIKEVVIGGEKVTTVCREAGISRVLFYRWLARYKRLGKLGILGGLGRRVRFFKLSAQQRLEMIKRVKDGEAVVKVCRDFGVSRTIFYRWLKRYEAVDEEEKLEALQDKKPKIEKHWRQTPEKYEKVVLNLVIEHPELSTHKIVEFLPQIGGRPILSNHGVQNVLRRNNLTTYAQRLTYSQNLRHPVGIDRFVHAFRNLFTALYALPAPSRQFAVRFTLSFSLGIFLAIVILGVRGLWQTLQTVPLGAQIGLVFALIALGAGSLFFLYSLKYYFLLTLVLGFSRQVSGGKNGNGGEVRIGNVSRQPSDNTSIAAAKRLTLVPNTSRSWWQRIFGLSSSWRSAKGGPIGSPGGSGIGGDSIASLQNDNGIRGGLQPDLSHVKLERQPFVSIHLPLYNEKRVVDRLLTACTSQDYPNFEVIVADDSTDETTQILGSWQGHPKVKISHRETREGYKGGALRKALEITDPRAEFVIVFDSDFLPYPDTITQFLKYFQVTAGTLDFSRVHANKNANDKARMDANPSINSGQDIRVNSQYSNSPINSYVAAVQGYQWHVLNKSENWITRGVRSEYAGSYVVERSGGEILGTLKQIAGSVYMIRKDILERYGWGTSITEDFELTLKLYRDGYKVVYTPYIQTPSECVSTLKRLIRQRMRWAEGHSHNIKRMFGQLIWGRWEPNTTSVIASSRPPVIATPSETRGKQSPPQIPEIASSPMAPRNDTESNILAPRNDKEGRVWVPSKLTLMEKLEFLYLSPYYLQAALFIIGSLSWFLSEAVFHTRLPFWTSVWGWSLVFTNLFALPLMNTVGLFLEESEERDYTGILSFVTLSYLLAPFQGYAAVKGFLERQEGPWFRTPKTGRITDIFTPGRFTRFISGIFGRPAVTTVHANALRMEIARMNTNPSTGSAGSLQASSGDIRINSQNLNSHLISIGSPNLSLATANDHFDRFRIKRRRLCWAGKAVLAVLLAFTVTLFSLTRGVPEVLATNWTTLYLRNTTSCTSQEAMETSVGSSTVSMQFNTVGQTDDWYSPQLPTEDGDASTGTGPYTFTFEGSWDGTQGGANISIDAKVRLVDTSDCVSSPTAFDSSVVQYKSNVVPPQNHTITLTNNVNVSITSSSPKRIHLQLEATAKNKDGAVTLRYNNSTSGNNSRLAVSGITIPERVVAFLAITPFIPMMVLWMRKRKIVYTKIRPYPLAGGLK